MQSTPLTDLQVLFVASEIAPFAKTGGLADVCASLPAALARLGLRPVLVMPYYRDIVDNSLQRHRERVGLTPEVVDTGRRLEISLAGGPASVGLWRSELAGCPVFLLEHDELYNKRTLYRDGYRDHPDNDRGYDLLCRGAVALCREMDLRPAVVHLHDWQSALLAAYVKTGALDLGPLAGAKSVLTIHNVGPKGDFNRAYFAHTGLPSWLGEDISGAEFWGSWSFLKAGLLTADAITTVSPAYAYEIQTRSGGMGLEDLLYLRRADLTGILNGVDYDEWSPERDPFLPARYSAGDLSGKRVCRDALLRRLDLEPAGGRTAVLGFVGRLAAQKGVGLLIYTVDSLLSAGLDVRLCALGAGDPDVMDAMRHLTGRFPSRVGASFAFDEPLAHLIYAGSDLFCMPSEFEPCGLAQLYALRYGTPVITRPVGGLKATVEQFDPRSGRGTGFLFAQFDLDSMLAATWEALDAMARPKDWAACLADCMSRDFSWEASAREYAALYARLLA